jgi:phosphoglycolate phosphatase-like HAD superfamily hydrolase
MALNAEGPSELGIQLNARNGRVVKAVIFDIDGTLIDSVDQHARSWVETFQHFGVTADFTKVRNQIGKGADRLMPMFLPAGTSDAYKHEVEQFRSDLFKRQYLPTVCGFPRVRDLFTHLRSQGHKIVLASSCTEREIGHYKEIASIADLIDAEATSDDAACSKPAPDIFQKALERIYPIQATEAIVVGDSPFDAEAAARAGVPSIGLLCGGFSDEELRRAGSIDIYRDPEHLLSEYDRSPLCGSRQDA